MLVGVIKMQIYTITYTMLTVSIINALQYPSHTNSDISADDRSSNKEHLNKTADQSEQDMSSREIEIEKSAEEVKEKKFLDDAMETVLDPNTIIIKDTLPQENFVNRLNEIIKANLTVENFINVMDNLSSEVCIKSQETLWSYVTDINNPIKKRNMIHIASEEDEVKKQYWNLIRSKYFHESILEDPKLERKLRIIKERGINVQMAQSKQREEIDDMQRIWSRAAVCTYKSEICTSENVKAMSEIISIFKKSNNSDELEYYWKGYRDVTGRKVRPIFKDYVLRMNGVAESENFTDAGEMWRYLHEDNDLINTVEKLWREVKPLYKDLHTYVRVKLKNIYKNVFKNQDATIPAHLLGNLWAQDWRSIYSFVAPYPEHGQPKLVNGEPIRPMVLFDSVNQFYTSLGFESSRESYDGISNSSASANCLPSSHDMCDGVNYRLKWCGDKVTDVSVTLLRAARFLGHIQYFKSYRDLPLIYRDGPTPAFHEALSDVVAVQIVAPDNMKSLGYVSLDTGYEPTINFLMWLALEKLPLMAYGYVLDKWRWNVFSNISNENWNQYWWELRINETGISPPVARDETDLDPASKYHVVSHMQYITYLISNILEFQVLLSMCKAANHSGPLHKCSLYGSKEAGEILRKGMSLGASVNWRSVLNEMTEETELSSEGLLKYFAELRSFLQIENAKIAQQEEGDMNASAPIIVGVIVLFLTAIIVILYCTKKHELSRKIFSVCGLTKNGSLDIVTNEMPIVKTNEIEGIVEDKV